MHAGDSDDSDEWAIEELPPVSISSHVKSNQRECTSDTFASTLHDEAFWNVANDASSTGLVHPNDGGSDNIHRENEGHPMLLVDLTVLSQGAIHSKFDANSVNDPSGVRTWRRTIEQLYAVYASDASLIGTRTVIPCGSSVWRLALVTLRTQTPGHYFCPIFPPT